MNCDPLYAMKHSPMFKDTICDKITPKNVAQQVVINALSWSAIELVKQGYTHSTKLELVGINNENVLITRLINMDNNFNSSEIIAGFGNRFGFDEHTAEIFLVLHTDYISTNPEITKMTDQEKFNLLQHKLGISYNDWFISTGIGNIPEAVTNSRFPMSDKIKDAHLDRLSSDLKDNLKIESETSDKKSETSDKKSEISDKKEPMSTLKIITEVNRSTAANNEHHASFLQSGKSIRSLHEKT
jgi:hypothetical protein